MNKFNYIKIKELGDIITGRTPKTELDENYGNDYMFIGPTDLHKHFVIHESEKMISQKGLDEIKSSTLNGISILVGCIGWDMGNVGIIDKKCATNQQINAITNIKKNYNPFYIYYWLKNKKEFLFQQASVTRTPILNKSKFSEIKINIPKEKYLQDKISDILISLDRKIELNNHINTELEAVAKILYDYWFVQFDFPDANGNPYKITGGKTIYNPTLKRKIPDGWENSTIGEIEPNIITGKTPSKNHPEYFGGNVPFITIGDIRGNTYIVSTEETLTDKGAATQKNKFLPEDSICVTCIASPGLVGFVTTPAQTNQQINSLVCDNERNKYYLYFTIKSYFEGAKAKTGNTFANMNKGDFSSISILKPSNQVLQLYHQKAHPLFQQIKLKSLENQQLIQIRNWLLPMLMNGQVTIK
ncbi:TPA: restriction endonuclease subunit S [Proteus mirabilis]